MRDWRKKKTELVKQPRASRAMRPGREAHWPELEDRLHEWVLDKRSKGIGISGTMIRLKDEPRKC